MDFLGISANEHQNTVVMPRGKVGSLETRRGSTHSGIVAIETKLKSRFCVLLCVTCGVFAFDGGSTSSFFIRKVRIEAKLLCCDIRSSSDAFYFIIVSRVYVSLIEVPINPSLRTYGFYAAASPGPEICGKRHLPT